MKKMNKGFTLIELIIVIAILGVIALIAIPNLAGIRQRSQVSADIRTAEQIGKAIRIWQTDTDATGDGVIRKIPKAGDTTPIVYYAYYNEGDAETPGFYQFAGVDFYVGTNYKAASMSPTATYFISSIGDGVNNANQKVIVGIDELNGEGPAPKDLKLVDGESNPITKEYITANKYNGGTAGWAYIEQ